MRFGRRNARDEVVWQPVAVFAGAVGVFALHGTQAALSRDFGVFLYGGEQLTRGVPSYVSIFNSVGPLSDTAPGLAILAGRGLGLDPVLAARVVFLLVSAGCCSALFSLARRVFDSPVAGFLAAALLASAATFTRLSSDGPREKTLMLLGLLLALMWLLDRRWFLAGAATAVATLTWQPVLAVCAAGFVGAWVVLTRGRVRAVRDYVLGGAVPSALAVTGFAAVGALRTALDGFIVIDAVYTRQPSVLTNPSGTVAFLWAGYSWTLLPFVLGWLLLPMLLFGAWRRRGTSDEWRSLAVMVAAELGALGWCLVAINGPADLFDVLPFGALGLAGSVVRLDAPLPRPAYAVIATASVLSVTSVAAAYAALSRSEALVGQRRAVDSVMDVLPRRATVLSVNAPDAMVLAGRTNPSPWQVFNASEERYLDAHYPGGLPGYAAWVARTRPTLVVLGGKNRERWLQGVLAAEYEDVGRIGTWQWYASTSLGRLRDARVGTAVAVGREELRRTDRGGLYGPHVFAWRSSDNPTAAQVGMTHG